MRPLSAALDEAARRERQRRWHWCRRPNGFCDLPKWRLVAERTSLPLYQVVAFVNRLEEFANDAGNRGYARGEVGHFNAEEFGLALGMPGEHAARIFAALEAIGWVADGHVADFYDRNRDAEDDTAGLRKRRQRARESMLKTLARLARLGLIEPASRNGIETRLRLYPDEELFALAARLDQALRLGQPFSTGADELSTVSTGHGVSRVTVDNSAPAEKVIADQGSLSFPHVTRDVRRDTVTVTPEKRRGDSHPPVDNFAGSAAGAAQGAADDGAGGTGGEPQPDPNAWLNTEGKRIVTERMEIVATLADTRIARWRDQELEGDAAALAEIIRAADAADYMGARFHNLVVDGIRRARQRGHPQLPLPPAGLRRAGAG